MGTCRRRPTRRHADVDVLLTVCPAAVPVAGRHGTSERPCPDRLGRWDRAGRADGWSARRGGRGGSMGDDARQGRGPDGAGHAPEPLPGDRGADRRDRAERGATAGDRPAGDGRSRQPIPRALRDATDLVIFAAPSAHLRTTVESVAPFLAPGADLLSVVKGLERGTLLRMSEVIAEAGGRADRPGRGAVGPEPGRRGRAQPARLGRRRGRGPRTRRARRGAAGAAVGSGSTSTRTSSASSCAARSRTSSPSRPAPPTGSASATTARPGC